MKIDEHPTVAAMWKAFLERCNNPADRPARYQSWHFCDNQHDADDLAEKVCSGLKRGTASLARSYALAGDSLPAPGDYSVITNFDGIAQCIIKTVDSRVCLFDEVPESFAFREGEGDKSLAFWRNVHRESFSRELAEMGEIFDEKMEVVCETFEVVYLP